MYYTYIHKYVYIRVCVYRFIYVYAYRERERERERQHARSQAHETHKARPKHTPNRTPVCQEHYNQQRTATDCNTLQYTATQQSTAKYRHTNNQHRYRDTHGSTTQCNTIHTTRCNTLQHTACNTLQLTATHLRATNSIISIDNVILPEQQHTTIHCNSLQLTATHCNSLQLTATHNHTPACH